MPYFASAADGTQLPGVARTADDPDGWDPAIMRAGNAAFLRDRAAFLSDPDALRDFFALHRPGNDVSPAYVRYFSDRCLVSTARASSAVQERIVTLDVAPELAKIEVPLPVVHGTHDVSAPLETTGRRAAALASVATLKVYENAGHGLFVTHAEQLTADVREFMTG